MTEGTEPIPSPPGLPIVGHIASVDTTVPLFSYVNWANQYGPIYRLNFNGKHVTVLSNQALVNEACNESRFQKCVDGTVLYQIRAGVHDGLFTANMDEENWGIAHRVLTPAFGPMSIKGMFDEMADIASQLVLKWARQGSDTPIMVTDDFTCLALDTLVLCAMNYRFNSYYRDDMHPMVKAMGGFLVEAGNRNRRPAIASYLYRAADKKFQDDIRILRETADGVLQARKANPTDRKDLLAAMLSGVDPKTGKKMTDSSITDNLITFLIAGHETTSGLLSFAFLRLLKNPNAYRAAQEEVDRVCGTGAIMYEHISQLHYIQAVLRETLRLTATIPMLGVQSLRDQIIGGKYMVPKGEIVLLLLAKSQLDPAVYGDDANDFKPERMLDDNFERLQKEYPNCWKPFGNGARACIGRPFAWQEATLFMAMALQNLNFMLDDPNYQMTIKQTLTIKPKDFYMRAKLRDGLTPTTLEHRLSGSSGPTTGKPATEVPAVAAKKQGKATGKPINIYYGSNSGTCEALAQRVASDALSHGFYAGAVEPLDAVDQKLPTDRPVVIITASYEGEPPDNAARFVSWLKSLKGKELENVSYAVFGCGHHDWSQTFHRIPKLVDAKIEELGGTRLAKMGLTDVAEGDMFTDFETWEDSALWPSLVERYNVTEPSEGDDLQPGLTVEITTPRSSTLRQDVKLAIVVENKDLAAPGAPRKKHMEIQLPSESRYAPGDYLAVLPMNPKENILRVMRRFQLPWDAHITISTDGCTTLPTGMSIPAYDVFAAYVELAQPASKRSILALAEATKDDSTKSTLQKLANESYAEEVSAKRISILDLLEAHPSIFLPLGSFLSLLPPMRVRQYSISSSPLRNPQTCTLTYSVLSGPAFSGTGAVHHGVCSTYLDALSPGDKLHVAVRPSHAAFHLPADASHCPIMCIAAGTGLAPFRGFVQERAAQLAAGRSLAPALLYFGCRTPGVDDLYAEELARWEAMGAVSIRRAYSRHPEASGGCRYVQDRLYHDRNEVCELWEQGAKVYVCGSRAVGEGVKQVALKMRREWMEREGKDEDEAAAEKWFERIRNERYATDVFD